MEVLRRSVFQLGVFPWLYGLGIGLESFSGRKAQ